MNDKLLSSEIKNSILIIRINNNIDKFNFHDFLKEFNEIVNNTNTVYILINLRKLEIINSSIISLFLKIYKEKRFSEIYLSNMNEKIENILKMLNLEKIFKIREREEEVIKEVG
ncbi:MAG TPA: STAS domain-containing protein [bacterium]|nr:STAS domain-containing protein [bacterium]HOL48249.1 STAS domain-containing protein [bacterium]HPQ19370.1 STAS domain-containing protein [bacterium]